MMRIKETPNVSGCRAITTPVCRLALTPIMGAARARYPDPSRKLAVALTSAQFFTIVKRGLIEQMIQIMR